VQDITNSMLEFKEAIRHSWNTYFAGSDSPMSPEIQEAFEQVESGFLCAIVLAPLGVSERARDYRKKPLSWLIVKPADYLHECPIQIGERESSGNMRWGIPLSLAVDDRTTFEFFDFFDWYSYGFIDLSYVRVRVGSLPSNPTAQGSLALIEQGYCRFLFMG